MEVVDKKSARKSTFIRFSVSSHKARQKTASYAGVDLKTYRKDIKP